MRPIFLIAIVYILLRQQVKCKTSLYDQQKDHIEILDKNNFDSIVFNSDKVTFVEFYAHWCGACQRYSKHWKEVAQETLLWHSTVSRIAAINCGDQENNDICKKNNIEHYPTLKVFRAKMVNNDKYESVEVRTAETQEVIDSYVKIISAQEPKLESWPIFTPYISKSLKNFFVGKNINEKYGFLVVEQNDSTMGMKLILDFAPLKEKVLIKRVFESNQPLLKTLEPSPKSLPVVYLITKTKATTITYEKLDQNLLKKYVKLNGVEETFDVSIPDTLTNYKQMSALIGKFNKLNSQITNENWNDAERNSMSNKPENSFNSNSIITPSETKQQMPNLLINQKTYALLPSKIDKLHMNDLESGLNLMLRSDIGNFKSISGDKLDALKEWLRILKNYFPGRRVVRNFLHQIYEDINSLDELTSDEWVKYSLQKKSNAFLPEVVQWQHCLGSEPKYRGYPCSLWSIFHVLTVNQIELEKNKPNPFKNEFNVKEVFEGIRLFVSHFFTCRECVENFMKETNDYAKFLNKPFDAVEYLWQVHNKVNTRLAKDHSVDQDPAHPKTIFPSKQHCPKCYYLNQEENSESKTWNTDEVVEFLRTFYSKKNIITSNSREHLLNESQYDTKVEIKDSENGKDVASGPHTKSDFMLMFVFLLAILSTFGVMYYFFNYVRVRPKLKKHII